MLFSIIITAYNRQEFLIDSVKSALDQSLDRTLFEIIVVKNFRNEVIDLFLNSNDVKNIIMEGTIGEFLYAGISASSGKIISFLDDDDLIQPNKLENIRTKFAEGCEYLHNSQVLFNYKQTDIKRYNINNPSFNLSSISINKTLIDLNLLKLITISPDNFMFYCALSKNAEICSTGEKLTRYRIHSSTSLKISNDFNSFRELQYESTRAIYYQIKKYEQMFPNIRNIIRNDATFNKCLMKIYDVDLKTGFMSSLRFLFSFIHHRIQSYDYKIGLLYLILSFSPCKIKKSFIQRLFYRNLNNLN